MFTQSEENYLKAVFHLQQETDNGVSTSSLSEHLNTKAASVTEMLKKLADKKLVDYQKYYGVQLTETGKEQRFAYRQEAPIMGIFSRRTPEFRVGRST